MSLSEREPASEPELKLFCDPAVDATSSESSERCEFPCEFPGPAEDDEHLNDCDDEHSYSSSDGGGDGGAEAGGEGNGGRDGPLQVLAVQ